MRGAVAQPRAVALVGATATGKTALGAWLAERLDAEVVCADSRQVYDELEIGTGKPSPEMRAARRHHLFAALHLGQHASAGWYARAARETCEAIRARGRVPLLVGGSGLYLRALREGLAATPPHDPHVRARLRAELDAGGPQALHARLQALDPLTAARIAPRDRQRITRALEVYEATGRSLAWWHAAASPPAGEAWTVLELVVDPPVLRERIARRTAWLFAHGLVEETRALLAVGHGPALAALRAIGYDEAAALIAGRLGRAEAEARVTLRTAQLAKRQRTWFRHQVEAVRLEAADRSPHDLQRAAREVLRAVGLGLR